MKHDYENLGPWLASQHDMFEKRARGRKRREWIQVILVWAAVFVLLFLLDGKAQACGNIESECAPCSVDGSAL